MFANAPQFWRIWVAALQSWRSLGAAMLNPYRPELHYMRGPGPKWRDKHAVRHVR
jgi:hypothetical protein